MMEITFDQEGPATRLIALAIRIAGGTADTQFLRAMDGPGGSYYYRATLSDVARVREALAGLDLGGYHPSYRERAGEILTRAVKEAHIIDAAIIAASASP